MTRTSGPKKPVASANTATQAAAALDAWRRRRRKQPLSILTSPSPALLFPLGTNPLAPPPSLVKRNPRAFIGSLVYASALCFDSPSPCAHPSPFDPCRPTFTRLTCNVCVLQGQGAVAVEGGQQAELREVGLPSDRCSPISR